MAEEATKSENEHSKKCSEQLQMKIDDSGEVVFCSKCKYEKLVHPSNSG